MTDPEPEKRGGDAAIQIVSGFVPRTLLHLSRLRSLFAARQQARQNEMYPKWVEMTRIAWDFTESAGCPATGRGRVRDVIPGSVRCL